MDNWQGLTLQILQTLGTAHRRLYGLSVTALDRRTVEELSSNLETNRIAVERINTDYQAGRLRVGVDEKEQLRFQELVRNLSLQSVEIQSKEPKAFVGDLAKYVMTFLDAGPHGPGKGEPHVVFEGEDEAEAFGPDTHGSGEGEP